MLEMRLFGAGRIFDNGGGIKIASRRWTLPLLTYLLLQRGKPILRKRLAFALWPDDTEETALVNLRRNLHRLREMLPPCDGGSWIDAGEESIAWNVAAPSRIDILEYEALRADPTRLEEAVALYTGDLLEDFFDDWIAAERERLRELHQADLSALIVAKRSRREFTEAARFAQRLLQIDPWRENAVRSLMAVRYESGDAAGALAEYDRFARLLGGEMNAAPMPDTVALRDTIARGEAIFATSEAIHADVEPTMNDVPFVGRETEIERLRGQWARAANGHGGMHFVSGEAGIGKSRLVSELALLVEAEGGRVILGATSRPERSPYQCLAGALRSRLPLVAGIAIANPLLAALAELVPELRSFRDDIPPVVRLEPEREQSRLLDALTNALVALSRPRPLIVILEDLHRAEATTIDAIRAIVPRLARSCVLVVGTYRSEEVPRRHPLYSLVHDFAGLFGSTEVRPLLERDVRAIAETVVPEKAAFPGFIETLSRRSDGNALFVTELLRDVHRAELEAPAVPATLQSMISQRLDSLAPATRTVAEVASVAGEAFNVAVVQEIAGLSQGAVLDALDELLDRHVVQESVVHRRYEYAFTHHIVHASVYQSASSEARTRRHRRIARLLEETAGSSDERTPEIALHYERGGEARKAAVYYARAARYAAGLYANAEARDLIGRALELGEWSQAERFDLVLLRSSMHRNLGDASAESSDLDEAERLTIGLDVDARCAVLDGRIRLVTRQGDRNAELAAIDRLERNAASARDERWLAVADELRARLQERTGDLARSLDSALCALDRFQASGDDEGRARLAAYAARVSTLVPGRSERAAELIEAALRLAQSASATVRALVLYDAGAVAYESHDHQREVEISRAALDLSRETGYRLNETNAHAALGVALWGCWQIPEALAELREAARLANELGLQQAVQRTACDLGAVLIPAGDLAGGIEWSRRAVDSHRQLSTSLTTAAVAAVNVTEAEYLRGEITALSAAVDEAGALLAGLPASRFRSAFLQAEGRLLRCRREFASSLKKLEEALLLDEGLGRWENAAQELDDLALTFLGQQAYAKAVQCLQRSDALVGNRERPDEVQHRWVEACVRRGVFAHDLAKSAVRSAYGAYAARRSALREKELQALYESIPVHRAICLAYERDEWPPPETPCVVALPGLLQYRNAPGTLGR